MYRIDRAADDAHGDTPGVRKPRHSRCVSSVTVQGQTQRMCSDVAYLDRIVGIGARRRWLGIGAVRCRYKRGPIFACSVPPGRRGSARWQTTSATAKGWRRRSLLCRVGRIMLPSSIGFRCRDAEQACGDLDQRWFRGVWLRGGRSQQCFLVANDDCNDDRTPETAAAGRSTGDPASASM